MKIYCCKCRKKVEAYLVTGDKIYPHRPDLYSKHFYECPKCGNYVGCHGTTTRPLGCIPSEEIKIMRKRIHALLDPIWKSGKISRGKMYSAISKRLGYTYHTGETKTIQECLKIYDIITEIKQELEKQ